MKTGVFITARLGSTRLQRKHLLTVNGREIMGYLIDRLSLAFSGDCARGAAEIAIVTGSEPNNAPFAAAFPGITTFYGDDDNIPRRHLQAAERLSCDLIVSIDGDDILVSSAAAVAVANALRAGSPVAKTTGLPLGMNVWGYSTACLRGSLAKADYTLLETGWGRIFDQVKPAIISYDLPVDDSLRFTLDYEEDFRFFSAIISDPRYDPRMTDRDLVSLVIGSRYFEKNESVAREYWENFRKNIQKEESVHQ